MGVACESTTPSLSALTRPPQGFTWGGPHAPPMTRVTVTGVTTGAMTGIVTMMTTMVVAVEDMVSDMCCKML